ncbi:MAG: alkyl sulfatase dimerization domain-containing protein [Actinomycetota bacterium]
MSEPKEATPFTEEANAVSSFKNLDWKDGQDWEDAQRGFIASLDPPLIKDDGGRPVWDLDGYAFLREEDAPPSVNPSLWRQARLNMHHGLFKVTDHIYQVRGHDLSVMSIIETDTGYIVIDPLISAETARASMGLVYEHLGKKPVVAMVYTHSHVDHWGGVKGVISEADVRAGKVHVIAPEGFTEAAVSENVMAGNAMSRRAYFMYGSLLPRSPRGQVDAGLGKNISNGRITLIEPTVIISNTPTEMDIDGVKIIFQNTPDTEAPAEMHFFFPQFRALCIAENCTHNLHNLYTLRGAQVRDARNWARYIDEAIELFAADTDVVFASHHWPTWGHDRCVKFLAKQRDMYKYLHDEVLRLANHGMTMLEIAEEIKLPEELEREWYNRGYYGTISHDAKAIYQKYLGWFDGNPANLHPLPPADAAARYVEYMGGGEAVLARAREAFARGEYRWVAEVVNHLVFAQPDNMEARELQADALEQLGYQAESGPWRNFYLTGAMELREGVVPVEQAKSGSDDAITAMSVGLIFDYMAVRLNGPRAEGHAASIGFDFTDTGEAYLLQLENGVLNYLTGKWDVTPDAVLALTRSALNEILTQQANVADKVSSGEVTIEGDASKLAEVFGLMDDFDPWFNIVTP